MASRERLVQTATLLFYAEGIHAVGIDRIIAESGVAKATFYRHFPSKDDLVHAYLSEQDRSWRARVDAELPRCGDDPEDRVVALFEMLGERVREDGFRGCQFINAAAEFPDPTHLVARAVADHRAWLRQRLADLLAQAGDHAPETTARTLAVLYDGAMVAAQLDGGAAIGLDLPRIVRSVVGWPDRGAGTTTE